MYGIFGLLVGFMLDSIIISAIGLGLFVDELSYLLLGGKTHADNYSRLSLFGTLFFVAVVYISRFQLVQLFQP
jgi:hypothetical protein